ncbi:MAG: YpmA family protein [Caloramator sp.]|nr:YpmA family protein [Caloramator sp.]
MEKNHENLNLIALMEFSEYENMYKVVDFLNKNLKQRGLIFGLTRKNGKDVISIYDAEASHQK